MLLILAFRKLRQEDCYVFKIGVDYRVSIKSPKAIERHSYGQREGFLLQISSLTFVPFHFLMTAFLTPARETSRWFVWVLIACWLVKCLLSICISSLQNSPQSYGSLL